MERGRLRRAVRQPLRQRGDEDQRHRQGVPRAASSPNPDRPNVFEGQAIVFEGPEDYHDRIEDPNLGIDEQSVLVIRNCGPVGYPGSAEVVNMQPPAALLKRASRRCRRMGDGRQSGTSGVAVDPERLAGGGGRRRARAAEDRRPDPHRPQHAQGRRAAAGRRSWRRAAPPGSRPSCRTRRRGRRSTAAMVGQLGSGGCLEPATLYPEHPGNARREPATTTEDGDQGPAGPAARAASPDPDELAWPASRRQDRLRDRRRRRASAARPRSPSPPRARR